MEELLFPITLPPGMYQNGTTYQAAGRWNTGQLVRFFQGTVQNVKGWAQATDANGADFATLSGMGRGALAWRQSDGSLLMAFGTTSKLYCIAGGILYDETPSGFTTGLVDAGTTVPGAYGSATYGSGLYNVGAVGLITIDPDTWTMDAFGNYLAAVCTSDQKLYVWPAATGTPAATPTWALTTTGPIVTVGSTSGGASSIVLGATTMTGTLLQGQTFTVSGTQYTATANATASGNQVTVSILPTVPATITNGTAVTGTANQAPLCRAVVVTPEKFLVALGAGDPRTVQWASQETYAVWGGLISNSAGSFPLTTRGRILAGAATKSETLIWTDADLWRMYYVGGTLVYGFIQGGDNCGLIAPNAKVILNGNAYWMGRGNFYMYNGYVQPIPCDVSDTVFGNITDIQRAKIWAMAVPQYNEVWWFYPNSTVGPVNEINSYVIYNTVEHHWSTGRLARTCGIGAGVIQYPLMVDTLGLIQQHELPNTGVVGAITPYLTTGPIEIGSGDVQGWGRSARGERLMKIDRVVPDQNQGGGLTLILTTKLYPNDPSPVTTTIGTLTTPTDVRLTARQVQLEFKTPGNGTTMQDWRLGTMRLGIRPGGKR